MAKRSIHTKQAILDAAQQQFTRFGFAKITMDEIAGAIGMGKASLYYYFPTKEQLFMEVIRREHEGLMEQFRSVVAGSLPADEKLVRYAEIRFQYFTRLITLNVMEFRTMNAAKPMFTELFLGLAEKEITLVQALLREGNTTGKFRVTSIKSSSRTIFHILQGLRLLFLQNSQHQAIESGMLRAFKKEFMSAVHIVVSGISVPAGSGTTANKRKSKHYRGKHKISD